LIVVAVIPIPTLRVHTGAVGLVASGLGALAVQERGEPLELQIESGFKRTGIDTANASGRGAAYQRGENPLAQMRARGHVGDRDPCRDRAPGGIP
jgi:hypothetical protein